MDTLLRNRRISASILIGVFIILICTAFVVLFSKLHKNRPEALVVSEVFNSDTLQALNQRIDSSKVKASMLEKDTITFTKQHKFLMEEVTEIEKELEKLEQEIEYEKREIKRRKRNAE